jgi:hypothetical protein
MVAGVGELGVLAVYQQVVVGKVTAVLDYLTV